jgi:hypothetical protein
MGVRSVGYLPQCGFVPHVFGTGLIYSISFWCTMLRKTRPRSGIGQRTESTVCVGVPKTDRHFANLREENEEKGKREKLVRDY